MPAEGVGPSPSRRGRMECWAALAMVVGALILFWPGSASSIGETGPTVSHAALHRPAALTATDHAPASVPGAGATEGADEVTHGSDAGSEGVGRLGDDVGSAADRLLPGRDHDGDSSDRCRKDCPPPSDNRYNRAPDRCGNDCTPPSDDRHDRAPDKCRTDCTPPSDDRHHPDPGKCGHAHHPPTDQRHDPAPPAA